MLVLQKYSIFVNKFIIHPPKQSASNNNTKMNSEGAGFESRPDNSMVKISFF
jgi:hypothetical protein